MTFGTHLVPPFPQFIGEPGKRYAAVGCVLRNTGSGWFAIDDEGHHPINVLSVSNDGTEITVNFNFTAAKVVTFVACPDETMVAAGYNCGARVLTDKALIRLSQHHHVGGLVSYNSGTTVWDVDPASSGVTSASFNTGTGYLTIIHDAISGVEGVANSLNGLYAAHVVGVQTDKTLVEFKNWAGATILTPDANLKAFFTRHAKTTVNPNDYTNAGGNIWCYGIFEV